MTMIDPVLPGTATAASTASNTTTATSESDAPGLRAGPAASTEIRISGPGRALAGGGQAGGVRDHSDVDESGLPEEAKDAIKRLRALRAQLERKLQELEEARNSTSGTPDQRRVRISVLQQEVASLGAAINTTAATLNQAIRKLSAEQQLLAGSLAMN